MLSYPNESSSSDSDEQSPRQTFSGLTIPADVRAPVRPIPPGGSVAVSGEGSQRRLYPSYPPAEQQFQRDLLSSQRPPQGRREYTGFRTDIPLRPLDAPTQHRTYIVPSATAPRYPNPDIHTTLRGRDHGVEASTSPTAQYTPTATHSSGGGSVSPSSHYAHDEVQLEGVDPEELAKIERRRRHNTLAARRSRARKADHVQTLEDEIEGLRGQLSLRDQALMEAREEIVALRRELRARDSRQSGDRR